MPDINAGSGTEPCDLRDRSGLILHLEREDFRRIHFSDLPKHHLRGLGIAHDEVYHRLLLTIGAEERLDVHIRRP